MFWVWEQIVSVVLGRTDLDEEEQVELLRNVAAVAADEVRKAQAQGDHREGGKEAG